MTNLHKDLLKRAVALGISTASILAFATPSAHAVDGTWANPTELNGTLTSQGAGGVYTYSGALALGDAVQASATVAGSGLTNNAVYYVVGVSGGNYTLSATPGGAAITGGTAGTAVGVNGVYSWNATAASGVQGGASWIGGVVPTGVDATATLGSFSNNPGNNAGIAIQQNVTVGTITSSQTTKQWSLISSNLGTNTTLASLTFATTGATPAGPSINTTASNQLLRLGLSSSFSQGQLKINGTQGLTFIAGSGGIRVDNVDWSGFTDGGSGKGTITIQQGLVQASSTNGLGGTGASALNVTVGNASSPSGATAPVLHLANNNTVNNLNGTANARVTSSTPFTLTIGAGNGTNTDFLGIIGQTAAGAVSNVSLLKSGSGTQTISGQVGFNGVNTTAVTVNGANGTLVLAGTNYYQGATTVTAGTLLVNGNHTGGAAYAVNGAATTATLGGIGTIASAVTIGNGAGTNDSFLAPGNNAIGTLTTTSTLTLASDAQFKFELSNLTNTADQVAANGVTLSGSSTFALTNLGGGLFTSPQTFVVINNTSGSAIAGTFSGLAEGGTITDGFGNTYTASYIGGTGNDFTLSVVPEPSTLAFVGVGLAGILWRKRRRASV